MGMTIWIPKSDRAAVLMERRPVFSLLEKGPVADEAE